MKTDIKIQSGIPIPRTVHEDSGLTDAIRRLGIMDSFAIPFTKNGQSSLSVISRQVKIKVTTRSLTEDGKKVIRVWRTA